MQLCTERSGAKVFSLSDSENARAKVVYSDDLWPKKRMEELCANGYLKIWAYRVKRLHDLFDIELREGFEMCIQCFSIAYGLKSVSFAML